MQAVENMQKANIRGKTLRATEGREEAHARQPSLSTPTTPTLTPTGGARGFQPSETSAFSRPPSRASLKASSSPLSLSSHLSPLSTSVSTPPPTRPKPPSRSSSLQKISSGFISPAHSSPPLSLSAKKQVSPSPDVHVPAQLKLKYPTSPYTTHISPSRSPADSAPSPALSYSSTGSVSASSSPANTPKLNQSSQDHNVQTIHNLKTFWANASQKHDVPCPASLLRGGNKKMSTVQKDVLGLLNLSPRHESVRTNTERPEDHNSDNRPNGHQKLEASPNLPTNTLGGIRLPSGNGYKFLSPGHFFPSSKC